MQRLPLYAFVVSFYTRNLINFVSGKFDLFDKLDLTEKKPSWHQHLKVFVCCRLKNVKQIPEGTATSVCQDKQNLVLNLELLFPTRSPILTINIPCSVLDSLKEFIAKDIAAAWGNCRDIKNK